jgi:hypothetical protein
MTCPLPLGCCYYYIIPRFDAKHNPPRPFVGQTTTTPAHPLFFFEKRQPWRLLLEITLSATARP